MNRVAVRADRNEVRKLAAKWQVARNVDALGGVIAEIGRPVLGVEDEKRGPGSCEPRPCSALAEPCGWMCVLLQIYLRIAIGCRMKGKERRHEIGRTVG